MNSSQTFVVHKIRFNSQDENYNVCIEGHTQR